MTNTPGTITEATLPLEINPQADVFGCILDLRADWRNWA